MTTENIVAHHQDISLVNVPGSQNKFCSIWPEAKQALVVLEEILKNPIAKAAIGIVIGAGDAVSQSICGA